MHQAEEYNLTIFIRDMTVVVECSKSYDERVSKAERLIGKLVL
ncbi:hypothetical protein [Brevibacillus reuszeri]|nr:hypothetical protein [Brevibacillus reuszeri]